MDVVIKLMPETYQQLRRHVPAHSPAHDSIEKATRIDHAVEGVLFAGYSIVCSEAQAGLLLEIAREHCAAAVFVIEKALAAARRPS